MGEEFIIIGLIILAILAGTVISFVNLSSIGQLKRDVFKLNETIRQQREHISQLIKKLESSPPSEHSADPSAKPEIQANDAAAKADLNQRIQTQAAVGGTSANASPQPSQIPSSREQSPQKQAPQDQTPKQQTAPSIKTIKPNAFDETLAAIESTIKEAFTDFNFEQFLVGKGLLCLGGIVLAFGGIFLAKYSIEAGLFPPSLRIILGGCFGLALLGAAEHLHRHPKRFQLSSTMVSAAIASGGLITCFAMSFVAFDFYAFLSPSLAFAVLAIITLAATWLSLRYGPVLALIGVVGAYAVPALVSTGSNNILAMLVYVVFVSVSAVWVHAIVKRQWLWWLALAGHMGWMFIAVFISDAQHIWPIFAFALVSIYLFVLFPILGWKLSQSYYDAMPVRTLLMPRKEQLGILLPILALIVMFIWVGYQAELLTMLAVISAVLLVLPYRHSAFDSWPYIALILSILTYLFMPSIYDASDNLFPFTQGYLLAQIVAAIAIVYCVSTIKHFPSRHSYLLLLVLAPISMMGIAYALSPAEHGQFLYPIWSIEMALYALVFVIVASRTSELWHKMTFLILANSALILVFTMLLSASVLSMAIMMQIALMTYLSKKYALVMPSWIYKIAISAVLLRLTLAPWLVDYASEELFGLHWSIVIYPMVFGLLWFAHSLAQNVDLQAWFKGAMLHIVALFVTTETSYLIYGSYPDFLNLNFTQSVLLSMNWLILSGVYLWRKRSTRFAKLYSVFAYLLIAASVLLHLDVSLVNNPFVNDQSMGEGWLLNYLLPLWAAPALILYGFIHWQLLNKKVTPILWGFVGVFIALYVNGMIRHSYHDSLSLFAHDILQQELYVYSLVWLVISVGLIIFGHHRQSKRLHAIGFGILAIVVLKAFVIDLSNLEGLYRALSFIGLGLCIVGIGWLFQRLKATPEKRDELPLDAS